MSVPQLALPEVARRHAEMLAEDAAEMREIVEAPGEGDLADVAMRQHRRGQVALALGETLGQHVALERGLLVGEQIVDIARRDAERRGGLRTARGRDRRDGRGYAPSADRAGRSDGSRTAAMSCRAVRSAPSRAGRRPARTSAAACSGASPVGALAELEDEIIGEPFERTIGAERRSRSSFSVPPSRRCSISRGTLKMVCVKASLNFSS